MRMNDKMRGEVQYVQNIRRQVKLKRGETSVQMRKREEKALLLCKCRKNRSQHYEIKRLPFSERNKWNWK